MLYLVDITAADFKDQLIY